MSRREQRGDEMTEKKGNTARTILVIAAIAAGAVIAAKIASNAENVPEP